MTRNKRDELRRAARLDWHIQMICYRAIYKPALSVGLIPLAAIMPIMHPGATPHTIINGRRGQRRLADGYYGSPLHVRRMLAGRNASDKWSAK